MIETSSSAGRSSSTDSSSRERCRSVRLQVMTIAAATIRKLAAARPVGTIRYAANEATRSTARKSTPTLHRNRHRSLVRYDPSGGAGIAASTCCVASSVTVKFSAALSTARTACRIAELRADGTTTAPRRGSSRETVPVFGSDSADISPPAASLCIVLIRMSGSRKASRIASQSPRGENHSLPEGSACVSWSPVVPGSSARTSAGS